MSNLLVLALKAAEDARADNKEATRVQREKMEASIRENENIRKDCEAQLKIQEHIAETAMKPEKCKGMDGKIEIVMVPDETKRAAARAKAAELRQQISSLSEAISELHEAIYQLEFDMAEADEFLTAHIRDVQRSDKEFSKKIDDIIEEIQRYNEKMDRIYNSIDDMFDKIVESISPTTGTGKANIGGGINTISAEILKWLPPTTYSTSGVWSEKDILEFAVFEGGNTLQWEGCTPELLAAKAKLEVELDKKGWTITYNSAYRPQIYQAHLFDIKKGDVSKTTEAQEDVAKHGLKSAVAYPDPTAPHVTGVAFDAIVKNDKGKELNNFNFVSPELLEIANKCGLNVNVPGDLVHFQLKK